MYCILAWAIIGAASALCGPETCAVVGPSLPLNCKGTIIKNGGYCGCYDVCAKQAGESCQARPGLDGRSTYGTCEPGLICVPHGEMVSLGYGRCHIPRTTRWLTSMTHNTPCEQMRRARLLSMAVWQGEWTPVCDALGNFYTHQCDNKGQCFCVETHSGKMLTVKTLGAVDCSAQQEVTKEVTTTMIPTKAPAARFLDIMDMSHNTPCEQQRRARLMSMVVWQGQWVPVCDSQGNYLPHQCDNMGQCFCVETMMGTLLTAKSHGTVDCTGNQS
ncbi:hypothetical protein KP79_PYT18539 [Mizuhopecten yessoensis]|uniref:Thyroglobulin type-1 domain-containing protein n=1 Tax=Mizuhopecten yessoensis TaxID=6573 RepID=A0A210QUF8_MIZYE|nr:hypothetical protein KP79_PYT18539 [Mizuhopecten yessoensis]